MGSMRVLEFRKHGGEGMALRDHLQYNHYPPVSMLLLPVLQKAIDLARDEDFDTVLELPEGCMTPRASVRKLIEVFHLDTFLVDLQEGYGDEPTEEN